MTPLKLRAITADKEDNLPPSIEVNSMADKPLCTIWASGEVTFNCAIDYTIDELEQFVGLSKHFFSICNSLIERDKEIEVLKEKNKVLMTELMITLNPINERQ